MKKILVMGGNQFVGKALCTKLKNLEYEVYTLNRGTHENIAGIKHLKADRNNYMEVEKITENLKVDIIVDISGYEEFQIENNLPIYVPNKGEETIQFGYIDDLVDAIIFSFDNPKFFNQVFNISGEEIVTFNKFIELCGEVVGKKAEIKYVDLVKEKLKARDWFPFRDVNLYGSIEKLKNTGFKNKYSLINGLKETYLFLKREKLLKYPVLNEIEKNFD